MSKAVVLLDPGHGGYDPGAVAYGLQEKDLNLKLALTVATMLKDLKVLLTRDQDVFVSLADRVALSRRAGPGLFLSLHANAGGGRGFESFAAAGLKPGHRALEMQSRLHSQIMTALRPWNIVDRGRKEAAFFVLRHNPAPAVLIESLFIDNEQEAALWRQDNFIKALAAGVTEGIYSALGRPPEAAVAEKPEPGNPASLYTVQVGAFAFIENARQRLSEAREAGFNDAYIYHKQL